MVDPIPLTKVRAAAGGRAVHDVGGLDFGTIDREDHDLALWEKRVDAMLILLVGPKKGAFAIDAMRRVIEDYGEQQYDATTYYEKWVRAIRNLLLEQQVITDRELEAELERARQAFISEGRAIQPGGVPDDGAGRRP